MKIFLLDHEDWLGKYLSKQYRRNTNVTIFQVDSAFYQQDADIENVFRGVFQDKERRPWRSSSGSLCKSPSLAGQSYSDCLFLINVDLKTNQYSTGQDQEGIELLKHIRLTEKLGDGRTTHVVLYSFEEPVELLKRKPGNLIMLSEDVTFLRLPDGLPELASLEKLAALVKKRAEIGRTDFQRFVRCDYQLPDSAHEFSNWWGLLRLIQARDRLERPGIKRPRILDVELARLENKQLLFLSNPPGIVTKDETELKTLIENHQASIPVSSRIVYIDDEPAWGETLQLALEADFESKVVVDYRCPGTEVFDTDKSLESWVKKIGLGAPNDAQTPSSPASLLLLDLRLLGNKESRTAVEEMSGVRIVRIVRRLNPGLPIILMTASNKAYSYEAAMKAGVDGYWMKEGVGEHAPQGGSCINYLQLLLLISKVLGPKYQFLRLLSEEASSFEDTNKTFWWESYCWPDGTTTTADKATLVRFLDGIVILLRDYLRLFYMNYGFRGEDDKIEQSWISVLLVEAAKPLELVHQQDYYGVCIFTRPDGTTRTKTVSFSKLSDRRGDEWGKVLNDCRNLGAHAQGGSITLDWAHARSMLSGVMAWLMTEPTMRDNSPQGIWRDSTFLCFNGGAVAAFPQKSIINPGPCP